MTPRRGTWLLMGVVCAVVLALGVGLYASRAPRAEVVDEGTARTGWKTIEYQGVRVDIPGDWERLDRGDCEQFEPERWGPPGTLACGWSGAGVEFFDFPVEFTHGPGRPVRRNDADELADWGGYTGAKEIDVYASDDDRNVVEDILNSVE